MVLVLMLKETSFHRIEEHGVHSIHDSEIGGIHILKVQNFGAVLNYVLFLLW